MSRGSSVNVVTRLRAERQGFGSPQGQERNFSLRHLVQIFSSGLTHLPIQWVPGNPPYVKRPGRETDSSLHLAPFNLLMRLSGHFLLLLPPSSLLRGSILEEPWPPLVAFRNRKFLGVELLAPRPPPNLKDQWTTLSLAPTLSPVWLG